jgi:glycosyltransferase involved in cell wall biosynthesis
MRACHALVLPTFEEGSALVTYEARACGCVLVISDRAGAPAEAGVDALVHRAGDQDGLERDLLKLAGDSVLLARVRASSLARLDELTWSAAGARLVETYEEALGRRPVPASATPRG